LTPYLLDTNHCSKLIDGDEDLLRRLAEMGDVSLATSVIVRGELLYIAENSEQKDENLERVRSFLDGIGLYLIDAPTADCYGELKTTLLRHFGPKERKQRRRFRLAQLGFDDNDLWIAATALRHGLTLVSADTDFARIGEAQPLALEQWLPSP